MLGFSRASVALLVAMQAAAGLASPQGPAAGLEQRKQGFVNMIYLPSWGISRLSEVQRKDVTHIMYAFAKVNPDGKVEIRNPEEELSQEHRSGHLKGRLGELFEFKKANPDVKTLLSVGGWPSKGEEKNFATAANYYESRKVFVQTATKIMLDGGFDGLDIDWEFPENTNEGGNFGTLMTELRAKLDKLGEPDGYHFLLTLAVSGGEYGQRGLIHRPLIEAADFWHVMAYDYVGGWATTLQHHANLYPVKGEAKSYTSTEEAIEWLSNQGVSPSKMVLGLPSYAQVFKNVAKIGQEMTAVNWVGSQSIREMQSPDWTVTCDTENFVACQGINVEKNWFATFDSAATVDVKARWAKDHGLAGTFTWSLEYDLPGQQALYVAAAKALGELAHSPSRQSYPESRFQNVRDLAKPRTTQTSTSTTSSMTSSGSSASSSSNSSSSLSTPSISLESISTSSSSSSSSLSTPSISIESALTTSSSSSLSTPSISLESTSTSSSSSSLSTPSISLEPTSASNSSSSPSTPFISLESTSTRHWDNTTASVSPLSPAPDSESPVSASSSTSGQAAPTGSAGDSASSGLHDEDVPCESCAVPDYQAPAIDAVGMGVKIVSVVVVVDISGPCADKAVCGSAKPQTITKAAFTTRLPEHVEPPTSTISVATTAGAEPIPVQVAGRNVVVCATELGCRATDVPHLPGSNGVPASPDTKNTPASPVSNDVHASPDSNDTPAFPSSNGAPASPGFGPGGKVSSNAPQDASVPGQVHPPADDDAQADASNAGDGEQAVKEQPGKPKCKPRPCQPLAAPGSEASHHAPASSRPETESPVQADSAAVDVLAQPGAQAGVRITVESVPKSRAHVSAEAAHEADAHASAEPRPASGAPISAESDYQAGGSVSALPKPAAGVVASAQPVNNETATASPRVGVQAGRNQTASVDAKSALQGHVTAGAAKALVGAGPVLAAFLVL